MHEGLARRYIYIYIYYRQLLVIVWRGYSEETLLFFYLKLHFHLFLCFQQDRGDRGTLVVPLSAPVVPYAPKLEIPESATPVSYNIDALWPDHHHHDLQINKGSQGSSSTPTAINNMKAWRKKQRDTTTTTNNNNIKSRGNRKRNKAASADFNEFEVLADEESEEQEKKKKRRRKIEAYTEEDRIDVPNDPLIFDFKVGASLGGGEEEEEVKVKGASSFASSQEAVKDLTGDGPHYRIAVGSVGQPEPAYIHHHHHQQQQQQQQQLGQQSDSRSSSGSSSSSSSSNSLLLQQIDPNAIAYTRMSQPYGHQYPSYVSNTMTTLLGTNGGSSSLIKNLETSSDVVYGKDSSTTTSSNNSIFLSSSSSSTAVAATSASGSERVSLDALKETIGMTEISDEELIGMIQEMQAEEESKNGYKWKKKYTATLRT